MRGRGRSDGAPPGSTGGATLFGMKKLVAAFALLALAVVPAAPARTTANPIITVSFSYSGTVATTGPDGSPLGVTSGTPPVIPAGYYSVVMVGPGGCAVIPYWELKGPGVSIVDNLVEGELDTITHQAHLLPNSTYTWRNDNDPTVVYTFATSSQTVGTPPLVAGPGGLTSSNHTTISSSALVGSGILPFRGSLRAAVTSSGKLTLSRKGKIVSTLKAGKYSLTVIDKSSKTGFALKKANRTVTVTGAGFVGRRSMTVSLTAGIWSVGARTISVVA